MSLPDPKLELIFHEALTRTPREREAYVAAAAGGDARLHAEVRRLLAAHDEAGTYFDQLLSPEVEAKLARLKPEEAGEQIGPYKLMERIGQGGFGTVWVADQEKPVRRRVALKIIKMGMDTKEVIARFDQERQALAMMDHPNIARILDAGATEWGRPFFVMELVRGIKITDYCDQENLPTSERLALFIQVCNAVQHAHQKGIIHRDLKPSNILVTLHDGEPVPKVIDFGVAKATQTQRITDLTIYTQFQQMIGTPLYMSPEQAEMSGLDIDTRSDIYSLGVLLYELLAGRTPFDPKELMTAGIDEIRRTIREVDPQTPSMLLKVMANETLAAVARHRRTDPTKLTKLLRGDLDWIVMKALEKDRRRRYQTANELALDVEHHLGCEPVLARPPSTAYRLRKFARRHRTALNVTVGIGIVLILASIVSIRQAIRASKAEELANERAVALAHERDAKSRALEESEAITAFLTRIFLRPPSDGSEPTVAETLNRAAHDLENQSGTSKNSRAVMLGTIAYTSIRLGLVEQGLPWLESAYRLNEELYGSADPRTLNVMSLLSRIYFESGRRSEALQLREKLVPLCRRVYGADHLETLYATSNLAISKLYEGQLDDVISLIGQFPGAQSQADDAAPLDQVIHQVMRFAALKLWNHRPAEYETTRRRMLNWAANTKNPRIADKVARLASLDGSAERSILDDAANLARRSVELGVADPFHFCFQMTQGMAEFRSGRLDEADRCLVSALKSDRENIYVQGTAGFYRAMILARNQRHAEAHRLFAATEAKLKSIPPNENVSDSDPANADEVILWLAHREARSLLAEGEGTFTPADR